MAGQVKVQLDLMLPQGGTMFVSETTLTARNVSPSDILDWTAEVMARYLVRAAAADEPLSRADLALYFVARASDEFEALPGPLKEVM